MKVREVLVKTKTWRRLIMYALDLMQSGAECHDAGVHMIGKQLTDMLTQLASEEVEA